MVYIISMSLRPGIVSSFCFIIFIILPLFSLCFDIWLNWETLCFDGHTCIQSSSSQRTHLDRCFISGIYYYYYIGYVLVIVWFPSSSDWFVMRQFSGMRVTQHSCNWNWNFERKKYILILSLYVFLCRYDRMEHHWNEVTMIAVEIRRNKWSFWSKSSITSEVHFGISIGNPPLKLNR